MEMVLDLLKDNLDKISFFIFGIGVIAAVVGKIKSILKELIELLSTVLDSLKDNKLTAYEIEKIIKEAKDIIKIFRKKKSA